jgi:hypothetical protein
VELRPFTFQGVHSSAHALNGAQFSKPGCLEREVLS